MTHLKDSCENIRVMLGKNSDEEVRKNRNKLKPIIGIVILFVRLVLPFREHKDDSQYHPNVGEYLNGSVGNFIKYLGYKVRNGDTESFKNLQNYSSYISKIFQSDLVYCCGKFIKDDIFKDIKESRFFSVLPNEASVCSNQ